MNKKANGIIVPMLTPLRDDESIDYSRLGAMIDHICEGGAHGLFQISTTSEYARLSSGERYELANQTMQYTKGRIITYLGVSDTSTKRVLRNIKQFEMLKPDYLVCSLPYYYPVRDDSEIISFFTEITKNTSLPIVLYNIPVTCGSNISLKAMQKLLEIQHIVGIKDSSGDTEYLCNLINLKKERPEFSVLSGDESVMITAAKLGCDGIVPSLAGVFPKLFSAFLQSTQEDNWEKAEKLFAVIKRMNIMNNYSDSWLSAIAWRKATLAQMGICEPFLIKPYVPLVDEDLKKIDALIQEYRQFDWVR